MIIAGYRMWQQKAKARLKPDGSRECRRLSRLYKPTAIRLALARAYGLRPQRAIFGAHRVKSLANRRFCEVFLRQAD